MYYKSFRHKLDRWRLSTHTATATNEKEAFGFHVTHLTTPPTLSVFMHLPVATSQNFNVPSSEPKLNVVKFHKEALKARAGARRMFLASPSPQSSNQFDYSMQGLSVPPTQPAFIEWLSTICRSPPPSLTPQKNGARGEKQSLKWFWKSHQ